MARTVKCPRCKKENDKSVAVLIPHGKINKYYCPECAEAYNNADSCSVCGNKSETIYTVQGKPMCDKCFNAYKKSQEETKKCTGCGRYRLAKTGKSFGDGWYCSSCAPKRQQEVDWHIKVNDFLFKEQGEHYNPVLINSQIKKYREEQGMTLSGIYKTLRFIVNVKEISLEREGVGLVPFYYNEARRFHKQKQDITNHALMTPKEQWVVEQVVYTAREEHKPRLKRPMLNMEDIDVD